MKKPLLTFFLLNFISYTFSQSNENYIKTIEFNSKNNNLTETLTLNSDVSNTNFTASKVINLKPGFHGTGNISLKIISNNSIPNQQNITYYDGLGKPKQQIAIGQSPDGKDIIQHIEYDEFGRVSLQFLPHKYSVGNLGTYRTDTNISTKIYYKNKYPEDFIGVTDLDLITPYSKKTFDLSPLNRLKKQSSPGEIFKMGSGHELKFDYKINNTNEVKKYVVNSDGTLGGGSFFYAKGELNKSVVKGKNWKPSDNKNYTIEEFKNKLGKTILRRVYNNNEPHDTYFVYNYLNNLKYVLPPKLIETYSNNKVYNNYSRNWPITNFLQEGTTSNSLSFDITNDIITIKGSINSTLAPVFKLKPSTTKIITTTPNIPDMSLGIIKGNVSWNIYGGWISEDIGEIKIENDDLVFIRTNDASFFYADINISKTLSNSNIISQNDLNNLAYQYNYDEWNRLIEKKLPGKQSEYIIYDSNDRPILTQDGTLRANNSWAFTKYDTNGRNIYIGFYSSSKSRSDLQNDVNDYINTFNQNNSEDRISTTKIIGQIALNYENTAFPVTNITEILAVNYYDDYNFTDPDKPSLPTSVLNQNVTSRTNGLHTSSWIKTLNQNTWSKTYTFYDEKARELRMYSKNHLGGYTNIDNEVNFSGIVTKTVSTHKKTASDPLITITDEFEYNHTERLKKQTQQINNSSKEIIVSNIYDDIGILIQKKVGGKVYPLQTIDYTYNIKGDLTNINNINDDLSTTTDNDLFAFKLNYEKLIEGTATVPQLFNGNVTQTIWRNSIVNDKQSYTYNYDYLSRLSKANYRKGNSLNTNRGKFEVSGITYDKAGNINTLQRNGINGKIDNLIYKYETVNSKTTNKLIDITDSTYNPNGYKDTSTLDNNYIYDSNGRLITDKNKGITNIQYNYLNLPKIITFSNGNSLKITYDASGNKLEKLYLTSNGETKSLYLNGYQYQNDQLQFFGHSEGYTYKEGNNYKYTYVHNDHLGNNRLSYSDTDNNGTISNNEIFSKTDYYPFGLTHSGEYISGSGSNYNYKYQEKELQTENNLRQYDFGSRMYDPSTGRWHVIDPKSEEFFGMSPYMAMGNNPVIAIDPDGEFWFVLVGAIIGGYTGASLQQKSFNPKNWGNDWWKGAVIGAVVGAYGTNLLAAGAAKGSFLAGGGISQKTFLAKSLVTAGKKITSNYLGGIAKFDLKDGLKLDFSVDLDKSLRAGASGIISKWSGEALNKLYKPGSKAIKNGSKVIKKAKKASGLLANNELVGKLSRNLIGHVVGGTTSNLLNGKPIFKNLTYLEFGNGIIALGEGKRIVNLGKGISQAGSIGQSLIANRFPDFDLYNLSFNYSAPKAIFKYKIGQWWKTASGFQKNKRVFIGIGAMAASTSILNSLGLLSIR